MSALKAYFDVMTGRNCDFWPTNEWRTASDAPKWDAEQYIPIFNAVKLAASLVATDEKRWAIVQRALSLEAERYANERKGKG